MNPRIGALVALAAVGCGDTVEDVGDLGMLTYALHIDYEVEGGLRENRLVTGHAQTINVGLTDKGRKRADHPGLITHEVSPAPDAELLFDPGEDDDSDVPGIFLTAYTSGPFTVESYYEGELFDTITIDFGRPMSLDVQPWLREPGSMRFELKSGAAGATQVVEGTQVAFLAVPLDQRGHRLVGDYPLELSWDPEWAAIQTWNVLGVYEEEAVFGSLAEESLVFVDPATVTVELVDEPNGMVDSRVFEVTDAGAMAAR